MEQNMNLYHIFLTVANCGNISAAARELFISQPAISKAISRLEQSLDTTLFLRSSRGVKLTESGRLLYDHVQQAFSSIEQAEERLKQIREIGYGKISIGVSAALCKHILLPYLRTFSEQNPHVQISLACQPTQETLFSLENGSIDIGLVGEAPRMDRFNFYPLETMTDALVCTTRYLENLKKREFLTTHHGDQVLSGATLLLLNDENITRRHVDPYIQMEKSAANQILEVNNMDLLIELAKIGLGAACVIENFVRHELENGDLIKIPFKEEIPSRQIGFAVTKGIQLSTAAESFLDLCLKDKQN